MAPRMISAPILMNPNGLESQKGQRLSRAVVAYHEANGTTAYGCQVVYDPWHNMPVLMLKPGALRNGAPF